MAVGFALVKSTTTDDVEEWTVSSLTLAIGDLLELDAGATAATESDSSTQHWQKMGVVTEAVTTSDTLVKVIRVNPWQTWEVQSNASSSATHNGDNMVLTDKNTVNNSGTNSTAQEAVVKQIGVTGSASDKRILVQFLSANGIDPDRA
jgi:hypothetical protein